MPINGHSSRSPKLRNSCDGCSLAKVKCSKGRPLCARCESHGVQCVYGVSMRAGKHRAAESNIQKPSPESPMSIKSSIKESRPKQTLSQSKEYQSLEPMFSSMTDSLPLNADWSSILTDEFNAYLGNNTMDTNDSSTSHQEHCDKPIDFDHRSGLSFDTTQMVPQAIFIANKHHLASEFARGRAMSGSALITEAQSTTFAQSDRNCNCNEMVLQQLLALDRIPDISAAVDTALYQNKQIIALCHTILNHQSRQHHDTSFVLALTALISKVADVYETIYKSYHRRNALYSSDTNDPRPSHDIELSSYDNTNFSGAESLNTHHDSVSASFSGMITPPLPVRLTLGTYRLDEKEEERSKRDMFKIEISRVNALIDAFAQRYCNTNTHDYQGNIESKLCENIVCYLKKKLQDTFETSRN